MKGTADMIRLIEGRWKKKEIKIKAEVEIIWLSEHNGP